MLTNAFQVDRKASNRNLLRNSLVHHQLLGLVDLKLCCDLLRRLGLPLLDDRGDIQRHDALEGLESVEVLLERRPGELESLCHHLSELVHHWVVAVWSSQVWLLRPEEVGEDLRLQLGDALHDLDGSIVEQEGHLEQDIKLDVVVDHPTGLQHQVQHEQWRPLALQAQLKAVIILCRDRAEAGRGVLDLVKVLDRYLVAERANEESCKGLGRLVGQGLEGVLHDKLHLSHQLAELRDNVDVHSVLLQVEPSLPDVLQAALDRIPHRIDPGLPQQLVHHFSMTHLQLFKLLWPHSADGIAEEGSCGNAEALQLDLVHTVENGWNGQEGVEGKVIAGIFELVPLRPLKDL
mmetsp:Transcript_1734/g.3689  ORF Transcript_1734/g.3689 Transcript_1734/m.3689 type:complete len:348 (-) Transcript_1734:976-2019(-)